MLGIINMDSLIIDINVNDKQIDRYIENSVFAH